MTKIILAILGFAGVLLLAAAAILVIGLLIYLRGFFDGGNGK